MNNVQITGMRNLWADVNTKEETMTAREMAFISHNLTARGEIAKTADGRKFVWDNTRKLWLLCK